MKERVVNQNPLFLRFVNGRTDLSSILQSFSRSSDIYTVEAARKALEDPPDLGEFKKELEDAIRDIIKEGPGDHFKAFVNHYMEPSLEQDTEVTKSTFGENRSFTARVKDESAPWVQGLICFNLCLYIKAFGLQELKACKTCGKLFGHKGKWALYCSDGCKPPKK